MKVPGFRKGKVPAAGGAPAGGPRGGARRGRAPRASRLVRAGRQRRRSPRSATPRSTWPTCPRRARRWRSRFEVGVRPKAELGDYKGVEVGRREPEAAEEDVQAELERMRESLASLETVERGRRAERLRGDRLRRQVDGEPFEGGEARGFLLELGSGRLIPGFEEQLIGRSAGDEREVEVTFPEDYQAEHLAGKEAVFDVDGQGGQGEAPPRARRRLRGRGRRLRLARRAARGDPHAAARRTGGRDRARVPRGRRRRRGRRSAKIDVPHELVHAKAHEMWHVTARRLQRRASTRAVPPDHRQDRGGAGHRVRARRRARAAPRGRAGRGGRGRGHRGHRRRAARRAARGRGAAAASPSRATRRCSARSRRRRAQGRDEALREDIAMRKAVDLMVENAKPIAAEQAEARDKLWTPEKEAAESPKKLWTPGSGLAPKPRPDGAQHPLLDSASPVDSTLRRRTGRIPSEQAKQSESNEPTGPNGRRADLSRRARVRHLLPAAERAHRLPRHAGHRRDRQPDRRAAAAPAAEDPDKDISLYINSPGGSVYAGLAIYDTMQFIKPDVQTICVGIAMSMGALLLSGGAEGKRMSLPNAKILIHQVSSSFQGQATGHRDPRQGDHRHAPAPRRDPRPAHRPGPRKGGQGHRARLLHERRRGEGLRPHRSGDLARLSRPMARPTDSNEQLLCSFCGKSQRQVKKLIAGPGVYICDECIDLCNEIIDEELTGTSHLRPREPAEAEGDLLGPAGVRGRPGARQAHAVGGGLQPLQARADDAVRGRAGPRAAEVQHPAARPDRLRQDAARADARQDPQRPVRDRRRHGAHRGRLRGRGRREHPAQADPGRRLRREEGRDRDHLHRRGRQDRAQGGQPVDHARRVGRGRPAGAAQDPRGHRRVGAARRAGASTRTRSSSRSTPRTSCSSAAARSRTSTRSSSGASATRASASAPR